MSARCRARAAFVWFALHLSAIGCASPAPQRAPEAPEVYPPQPTREDLLKERAELTTPPPPPPADPCRDVFKAGLHNDKNTDLDDLGASVQVMRLEDLLDSARRELASPRTDPARKQELQTAVRNVEIQLEQARARENELQTEIERQKSMRDSAIKEAWQRCDEVAATLSGRRDERTDAELAEIMSNGGDAHAVMLAAASLADRAPTPERAEEMRRKALEAASRVDATAKLGALNDLAILLEKQRRFDDAKAFCEEAHALDNARGGMRRASCISDTPFASFVAPYRWPREEPP